MADKKFGVKQINLIGASGTPTLTSPNNLNINAANVAISTDISVGGRIVGTSTSNVIPFLYNTYSDLPSASTYHGAFAHVHESGKALYAHSSSWFEIVNKESNGTVGTGTEVYSVGSLAIPGGNGTVSAGGSITGSELYGDASLAVSGKWTLGANGSSDYTFTGTGIVGTENDPIIYLARGAVYEFVNNSGGSHPFQIRQSNGGSAYNTGVTNNGASSGTIRFEVPFSAPNTLYYQCTSHSGMGNNIVVYPTV